MSLKDKVNQLKRDINNLEQYLPSLENSEEKANMQLLIDAQFAFMRMMEYANLYDGNDRYEDLYDKSVDELEIRLDRARLVSFSNEENRKYLRYMTEYWDDNLDERK